MDNTITTFFGEDEIPMVVGFWYRPKEEQTHNYPGCEASVELEHASLYGEYDILFALSSEVIDGLVDECLSSVED